MFTLIIIGIGGLVATAGVTYAAWRENKRYKIPDIDIESVCEEDRYLEEGMREVEIFLSDGKDK